MPTRYTENQPWLHRPKHSWSRSRFTVCPVSAHRYGPTSRELAAHGGGTRHAPAPVPTERPQLREGGAIVTDLRGETATQRDSHKI